MRRSFYIRTFGCQMNISDSEIVISILTSAGYEKTASMSTADVILFNTCSVRDKAEQSLYKQVKQIKKNSTHTVVVGILGCMAQRLKDHLLENDNVDFVLGVDEYRRIVDVVEGIFKTKERTVLAEFDNNEFYDNLKPHYGSSISAFVPIIRGCNNYCTYCVVPYTRGKEKSRDFNSIITEIQNLQEQGYKEVTLLGENVNSYRYDNHNFASLLAAIATTAPTMRIRFTSSNPQDISLQLVKTIKQHDNICRHIHLPLQSGSNRMLRLMNRKYTREEYLEKIDMIHEELPWCSITTDIICGFCDETEEDHQATLDTMETVSFDSSFTFIYSERSGTFAEKNLNDNIPLAIKRRRLEEVIELQRELSEKKNDKYIGNDVEVLVEGPSKRNKKEFFGRTTTNKVVIFHNNENKIPPGTFLTLHITEKTSATLFGRIIQ